MDIVKFKKQVQQGKLDHFYVFTGDEIGLQNIYLNLVYLMMKTT